MSNFTIALSGLSEDDIASVQTALDVPDSHWSLVDGANADLLMVDIDSVWGHMDWLRATATGTRTIAFTDQTEVRNCDLMLRKPLNSSELLDLLARLNDTAVDGNLAIDVDTDESPDNDSVDVAMSEPVADVSAADPQAAREPEPEIQPEPPADAPAQTPAAVEEHVSLVARARAAADLSPAKGKTPSSASQTPAVTSRSGAAEIATPAGAPSSQATAATTQTVGSALLVGIIARPIRVESHGTVLQIDPEHGGYYAPAMLKPLQPLLQLPISDARPLDAQALKQLHLSPALPLTRLLWFAALCSTPGELTAPLGRQAVYHLTRWPQIEREFPRHFRIATAMMKHPDTIDAIAEAAKAPVADVIDFINAYFMAGFVNSEAGTSANGVLSRLRRPFGR